MGAPLPTIQITQNNDATPSDVATSSLLSADGVTPQAAWTLFSSGQAVLVDVRTAEERARSSVSAG